MNGLINGIVGGTINGRIDALGSLLNQIQPPTLMTLAVASDTQNNLAWTSNEEGASYVIERSLDGLSYSVVDTTAADAETYSDTGLTAEIAYYYRIRAKKGSAYSAYLYLGMSYIYMRYWETKSGVNTVYYASPTGSGANSTFASPSTFNTAIGKATTANDVVVLMPGTYNYVDGTELDYKGIGANGVIVSGLTLRKSDVVVDFNATGDGGGWLYCSGKTGVTIQHLTIQDMGTSSGGLVFNLVGASSGTVQYCKFIDIGKTAISITGDAGQGNWKISKNIFSGTKAINASSVSVVVNGSAAAVDVDIEYNVFMSSVNNLGSGVFLSGVPAASRNVDFYNNEFYGTNGFAINSAGDNYTGNIKNNIFAGCGAYNILGGYRAVGGNTGGYASTVDYNFNYGSVQTPRYYDSQITPGANEVNGNYNLKLTKSTFKSIIALTYDDASGVDTVGFDNWLNLVNNHGWKSSSFIDVKSWDSIYGGSVPSKITNYLAGGHDIGIHSFSHTPMTVYNNAITIAYSGGGTKSVSIVTDVVGGGADWNGILKDYTQWSGSITIDVGGAGEDTLNLYSGGVFKTLADVKAWIETHANWTATVKSGSATEIASGTPAISLANTTTDIGVGGTAINVVQTPYIWMETKYAKDRMEAILLAFTGSAYTVKTWGSPYHLINTAVMDALMEAGYIATRGANEVTGVLGSSCNSWNFAPYCISTFGGGDIVSGNDGSAAISEIGISTYIGNICAAGNISSLTVHTQSFDNATELTVWGEIFDILQDFESMGLMVLSQRELAELIEGDSFTTVSGTVGNDLRLKYTNTEQLDGTKRIGSTCIDAGIDVGLTTDIEDAAVGTPPNIGAYE